MTGRLALAGRRVPFPYLAVFLALLAAYMAYSVWASLDVRYPIVVAIVLLVATAAVDWMGDAGSADILAEYAILLLGAGAVLVVIDRVRAPRAVPSPRPELSGSSSGEAAEPPEPWKGTTDHTLDRLEEQAVPVVDASRRDDEDDEEHRDEQARGD